MRSLLTILMLICGLAIGFFVAKSWFSRTDDTTQLMIQNYSFVREIAELSSLEVNGVTQLSNTNIDTRSSGWTTDLKKMFLERTYTLSMPYTAKYGMNLRDSSLKISREDSTLVIEMPAAQLLSFELRLDKMTASSQRGIFRGDDEARLNTLQKELYTAARKDLEGNARYISLAQEKVCGILSKYYAVTHMKVACRFAANISVRKD